MSIPDQKRLILPPLKIESSFDTTAHYAISVALFLLVYTFFSTSSHAVNVEPCSLTVGKCLIDVGGKQYLDASCNIQVCLPEEWDRGQNIRIGGGAPSDAYVSKYFADIKVGYDQNMDDADQDTAIGFWNGVFADDRSQSPLGTLKREGECWINSTARVCGWR